MQKCVANWMKSIPAMMSCWMQENQKIQSENWEQKLNQSKPRTSFEQSKSDIAEHAIGRILVVDPLTARRPNQQVLTDDVVIDTKQQIAEDLAWRRLGESEIDRANHTAKKRNLATLVDFARYFCSCKFPAKNCTKNQRLPKKNRLFDMFFIPRVETCVTEYRFLACVCCGASCTHRVPSFRLISSRQAFKKPLPSS